MSASARKNSSVIWHHFVKDNTTFKETCNECKEALSYKSATANLKSHLRRKHPAVYLSVFKADDDHQSNQPSGHHEREEETRSALPVESDPVSSSSVPGNPRPSKRPPPTKRQKIMDAFVNKKISSEKKLQIDKDLLDL